MNDIEKLARLADSADSLLALMPEIASLRAEIGQLRAEREKPLTTAEAAEWLGVTPATVVNWVNRGMIPALMSRGGYRIPAHRIFAIAERQAAERAAQDRSSTLSV